MIEQVRAFPQLARIGLLVMVTGAALEVVTSVTAGPHAMHHGSGVTHAGHLVALVGMVLVLAGVAIFGSPRQRSRGAPAANDSGGLETNAHR